jgi:hypothetical protein
MRKCRSNSNNPHGSRGARSHEHSVSGELILYTTEDGQSRIHLRAQWATTNLRLMARSSNMIVKSMVYSVVVS